MKRTNTKFLKTSLLIAGMLFIVGCEQNGNLASDNDLPGSFSPGVFIINEGNFGSGNGSVSYLDLAESKMYNHIFQEINDRSLGDIPQSMYITESLGFIVINNSAKIEVINMDDFRSVNTISGFSSPRHFLPVSDSIAYVSDMFSGSISVVNLDNFTITKTIETGISTEQMMKIDDEIFVANWMDGNKILIINPIIGEIIDSIEVIIEPNSMVLDKNHKLWVLCSGGYLNEEMPGILRIDPSSRKKEETFRFSVLESSPSHLCINGLGDTLYFLNNGIIQMPVSDTKIPSEPLVQTEKLFYSIGIDPENGIIYAADAVDYQQKGKVFRYLPDATLKDSFDVDIIPGSFVFNR
ncbi:MAG: YncE family protein [Bacteroidales bacterium]|nr:YncE family protein [Bacteroidales bacterium]